VSEIPGTPKAFDDWWVKQRDHCPPELEEAAQRARLALWQIENNPREVFEQSAVMREATVKALTTFAEAYGRWQEWKKRST